MARIVGIFGGWSIGELGPIADVKFFFDCVHFFSTGQLSPQDRVILDRLHRRYLRLCELPDAQVMMDEIQRIFGETPGSAVDFDYDSPRPIETWLRRDAPTLAVMFSRYFENFAHCREVAELYVETVGSYEPVRLVYANLSVFVKDAERPLREYDDLNGEPFWTR
jgi:hypothetical protein